MTSAVFESVRKNNLAGHVKELTSQGPRHVSNSEGVAKALAYLKKTLSEYDFQVHEEKYGKQAHDVNLWCELPGTGKQAALEIGAHWDTVKDSPGADDNASGVAGVLEIARVLKADAKQASKLARTVRFCFFGGEEDTPDLCTGSRHHVTALQAAPDGAIVLEMIAYRSTGENSQTLPGALTKMKPSLKKLTKGDFIAAVGIDDANAYLEALANAGSTYQLPVVAVPLPSGGDYAKSDFARSDHFPYWQNGWRGVMVTDTADFRNPNYHKKTDTDKTLDFDFATQVTATVLDAVRKLAG
jgi:Zn-dependent M28 family amino/carboxypeptidase